MQVRDRIKELRRVKASSLLPNKKNYRLHPSIQVDAIRGALGEIGWANAAMAYESTDGSLILIDGHMRAEMAGDDMIPVLILDVTESEAEKILATFDPLGSIAEYDDAKFQSIIQGVGTDSEALQLLLDGMTDHATASLMLNAGLDSDRVDGDSDDGSIRLGDKKKQIKPVLYIEQLEVFERALAKTGNVNRGEAIVAVCQAYLDD